MIVTLIVLAIILSVATAITIRFKIKQENSILITFLTIGLILYLFGLINIMKIAIYLIIAFAVGCFIYDIVCYIKRKISIQEIFTHGSLIYILLLVISSFLLENTYYKEWDEFSHWGSNLKAMVTYDLLWANKIYDGVHVVYQPLAGIYEYFFCKINGGFQEDISYMAINTFIITLLIPMLRNFKYEIKDFLKSFFIILVVFALIYLFGFCMDSIYIDLLLAILFTSGMIYSYWQSEKGDKLILWLLLIAMVLLKDTGMLLAGIVLMQYFFKNILFPIINKRKIEKDELKKIGIICLILLTMLIAYGSWKVYCKSNGKVLDDRHDKNAIVQFDILDYIGGILQIPGTTEKIDTIAKTFYSQLNRYNIIKNPICSTAIQIMIVINLLSILIVLIEQEKVKKEKIISFILSMNIGFILYCMLLMATYMFAFTETEGRNLASYGRYMNTYFIAWMIMLTFIMINTKNKEIKKLLVVIALVVLYGTNILNLIRPTMKGVSGISEEIIEKANIIQENVENNEKVYLIYQNIGDKADYHILRYCISPIVTNLMYEWNLGAPYFEGDIWTYDITKEEWIQKLKDEEFDYVFIAKSDERFVKDYGEIFKKGIELEKIENHLFSVVIQENGELKLELYK